MEAPRPRLLFIGAFPPPASVVRGGNVQDCRVALESDFATVFRIVPIDSTQTSVPPPPACRRLLPALERLMQVVRAAGGERPDGILIFAATGLSFFEKSVAAAYAKARGIRVLLFIRDGHFMDDCHRRPWFRWAAKRMLGAADYVLCQGETWRVFFTQTLDARPERCPIVENWVATPDLLAIGASRSYRAAAPLDVLFVGWVTEAKGIFELLAACRTLAQEGQRLRLHVCGNGDGFERARSYAIANGLDVTFHGWVDEAEKRERLRAADVFVLPSHVEGFPNALVEAMAAGLPSVTTRVGSIPDFVVDGENGLLTDPRDVGALTDALRSLDDPERRRAIGVSAYETARALFTPARAARKIRDLLLDPAGPR